MGVYTEAVQQLYVAYFNRPADVAGLTYWEGVVANANGSTAAVSAAFAASAEYKAAYANMDAYHVVAQVYQNLFGHAPDLPGLNFWGQALIAGQMTVDNVVTEIAKGAQGTDLTAYNNKVTAATAFTTALDTPAEVLAYSGDAANALAKNYITGVTDDASLAAAIEPTALNTAVKGVVDAYGDTTGKTFTLTAGLDNLVGTSGNDVFNAYSFNATTGADATNLSSYDSIDGGAGKDTLNLDLGQNTITGTIKNVEVINLTSVTAAVDASVFQGATNVNVSGADATDFTVNKLAAGATAGFNSSAGNITIGAAGASAAVALTNVAEASTITVAGSTLSSVTVSGTRADTSGNGSLSTQALNITAGKNVQSVTVTTNQDSSITLTENAATDAGKQITSLDASASTGKLTIVGDADLLNIKTGTANDTVTINAATAAKTDTAAAVNASVSTGDGNDKIVVNIAADSTGLTSVDAGAGNDTITVNKIDGASVSVLGGDGNDVITVTGTLATTDVIGGGAGSDTIKLAGMDARTADDYIVFNKLVTGFETISFSSAETGLDASKLAATYTGIDLFTGSSINGVGSQAITAHGDVTLTAAGYKAATDTADATHAGTIGVSDNASGTVTVNADVVNLAVKATTVDTAVTLAGDVQTATVALTNSVNASSNATADTFASVTIDNGAMTSLKSLTLTGNGSATVHNAGGALVTVDASGLGGTLTLGDDAGSVTGGLNYTSENTKVETIKLGSGIDHVTLSASTYAAMDIVTGLHLVANSDASGLTAASDVLTVTGVTDAVKFTTTQTDIDLALKDAAASSKGDNLVFQLGGDTYVFHDGGTAGQIDAADTVVKITGTVDLDTLILSLGHTA